MTIPSRPVLDMLRDRFGDRLLLDEDLSRHTSARIGGPADAFLAAESLDALKAAARIAWATDTPLTILGGGSNILISDRGIRGLAVHNQADSVTFGDTWVEAESGASTIQLVRRLAKRGLAGFEWAIGVPGTLGGAVYGNAGAHRGDMARTLREVEAAIPAADGEIETVIWSRDDLEFEYRSSRIKREKIPCVILKVKLDVHADDPAAIEERIQAYNTYRKETQPPGATIGSMFKNPPGDFAGRLIEAAGLKGATVGGAQISEIHANFFLNTGEATAADVKALADQARDAVAAQFGVTLELEVELIGEWG